MTDLALDPGFDPAPPRAGNAAALALRWSARALVAIVWLSAAIFGLYIVLFYAGAAWLGVPDQWNLQLPGLHDAATPAATAGIAAHFAAGGILLLLGPIQLIGRVRNAAPAFHRWTGRLYVLAAAAAGLGGLAFIGQKGTIGGPTMDIGFALYGALVVLAAVQTWRHARARRLAAHRAWAIRLFALAIGSWLYRIDYGFWFLAANGAGHVEGFTGPFDKVMDFFFYLPNLAVAEAFIRARRRAAPPALQAGAALLLAASALLIALATWEFTLRVWAPGMAVRI